jgi:hypothetical protein
MKALSSCQPFRRDQPVPAPGSLRDIILKNPSTRLYTNPLEWTFDHPRLLDCRVDTIVYGGEDSTAENDRIPDGPQWDAIQGALAEVQDCTRKQSRDLKMRRLVQQLATEAEPQFKVSEGYASIPTKNTTWLTSKGDSGSTIQSNNCDSNNPSSHHLG